MWPRFIQHRQEHQRSKKQLKTWVGMFCSNSPITGINFQNISSYVMQQLYNNNYLFLNTGLLCSSAILASQEIIIKAGYLSFTTTSTSQE